MKNVRVIIVGAGPAGSACAWKLQQHQVDFLLLDKEVFPRVKPCAGWITPEVLKVLGLTPEEYPGGITHFDHFRIAIKNINFTLRTDQYAIRRVELDNWLMARVAANYIHHPVRKIVQAGDRYIVDDEYSAEFLVGAGGTHCPVAKTFFKDQQAPGRRKLIVAMEEEFPYDHTDETCHLWFLQDGLPGYAWYVPKANGIVNVGVGGIESGLKANHDTLLRHWNLLTDKLDRTGLVVGHEYKPIGHSYYLRGKNHELRKGNAFLAGDAAGLATLDMGEGIGPAILSGMRAADSILTGSDYSIKSIARYSFPSILGIR
jgi:flavin-dependent dehydrogenase